MQPEPVQERYPKTLMKYKPGFHKNHELLENSIKELENTLIENNILNTTANEKGKLEISAKIGSMLLK